MEMDPDTPLRVHTWQNVDGWEAARDRGYLTGSHGHQVDDDPDWDGAYEWMRQAMAERIPDFSGDLPVWAWLKRQNPRRSPWIANRVRVTAMVPRRRILLSDYELWHLPLNNGAICMTQDEDEAWPHPHGHPAMMETWHHVLEIVERPWATHNWVGQPLVIQACIDRILLREIVSVRLPRQEDPSSS